MTAEEELEEIMEVLVEWEKETGFTSFNRSAKETLEYIIHQNRGFRTKYGRLGFMKGMEKIED